MWIDACEYLKKLAAADPARREIYESAFAAADELNFDRAEELLNQI